MFSISLSLSSLHLVARIHSYYHHFLFFSCPHVYHTGQCVCMHVYVPQYKDFKRHTHVRRQSVVEIDDMYVVATVTMRGQM